MKKISLTIISGLSGSGKTTALQFCEDLGFYCMDNIPLPLLMQFLEESSKETQEGLKDLTKIAVVVDARGQNLFKEFGKNLKELRKKYHVRLIYLEARNGMLQQRYSETRRRHPLSPDGSVLEGIHAEKKVLSSLRRGADKVIDTSDLNVHELKQLLQAYFHYLIRKKTMNVTLVSFGYKYGLPIQADLIFDVRFLPNPHFEKSLKNKTGKSSTVQAYVFNNKSSAVFMNKITGLLKFLMLEYGKEGKSYLTIAFGCTGGRHRSVAVVEEMKKTLEIKNVVIKILHRDSRLKPR